MEHNQLVIAFTFKLIDIQIQKYEALVSRGIGPDAALSAYLACQQVTDLLESLETYLNTDEPSDALTLDMASKLKFYFDCEYLRGRAGWLMDDNRVHNIIFERLEEQQTDFQEIESGISETISTDHLIFQDKYMQYLHDSHQIAFNILKMAVTLKADPSHDFGDDHHLGHGLMIMRRNAKPMGRYHQPEIAKELESMFGASKTYLSDSHLQTSTLRLEKDTAVQSQATHKKWLDNLLVKFRELAPDHALFGSDPGWYKVATIGARPKPVLAPQSSSHLLKWGMFGLLAAGSAAYVLSKTVCNDSDDVGDMSEICHMLGLS